MKVEFKVPQATELEKLEKKSLVTFIYVGKPTAEFRKKLGNESRIQSVSYTHLDVYKRQPLALPISCCCATIASRTKSNVAMGLTREDTSMVRILFSTDVYKRQAGSSGRARWW